MKLHRTFLAVLFYALFAGNCFAGTLVEFQCYLSVNYYLGEIDVGLYDQDKPITVNNFLHLTEAGAYDNGFFHRLVPGFVLQGGGYSSINPDSTNLMAPPYSNLGFVGNVGNIPDEINVGPFYSNVYGTIAMAKSGAPGTANSQFFFNIADNSGILDTTNNAGGYTVFGQVVRGTNVFNYLNSFQLGAGIVDLTQLYGTNFPTINFTTLPNDLFGTNAPPCSELIYYTVSILSAQIQIKTNGARQISWNSVSGVTNNVEYSTNLPPVWQVLGGGLGTGGPVYITDTNINDTRRFYRIHVLF